MKEVTETRQIKRLYYKVGNPRREGWSQYKCNICLQTCGVQIDRYNKDEYDNGLDRVLEHIFNVHPDYCHQCKKCNRLHTKIADMKKCDHNV